MHVAGAQVVPVATVHRLGQTRLGALRNAARQVFGLASARTRIHGRQILATPSSVVIPLPGSVEKKLYGPESRPSTLILWKPWD